MTGAQRLALSFGELTLPIECLDQETAQRLRAQLQQGGKQPKITLTPGPGEDQDVEGHTFAGTLRSVLVHVKVGESGQAQAIRVNFPTAQDAEHFRRNLIAAGLLAGTLAAGSIGLASISNSGAALSAGQTSDGAQATAHGYFVPAEGSAATAHGYYVQLEGSQGTAHGYFQQAGEVTGSQGTAHGYFQQAASSEASSVLPGSQYSGKASIGESLGLQGSASASDELAAQVTDGWAASTPAVPTSDELAAQVTDGWAASTPAVPTSDELAAQVTDGWMAGGASSQAANESAIPDSQGTAHGYFQQSTTAADEESTVPPGNPYSGKAAIDESLK